MKLLSLWYNEKKKKIPDLGKHFSK